MVAPPGGTGVVLPFPPVSSTRWTNKNFKLTRALLTSCKIQAVMVHDSKNCLEMMYASRGVVMWSKGSEVTGDVTGSMVDREVIAVNNGSV